MSGTIGEIDSEGAFEAPRRKRGSQARMMDALERERFWTETKMPESPWDVLREPVVDEARD